MRYEDGREVQLGDMVALDSVEGTVVAVVDTGQFDPAYLTMGVLISTTTIGWSTSRCSTPMIVWSGVTAPALRPDPSP